MGEFQNVLYEKDGHIATITINRPDKLNAIDPQTSFELRRGECVAGPCRGDALREVAVEVRDGAVYRAR